MPAALRDRNIPTPPLRQRLETEIERLIGLLDFIDGDPDLEANGDLEPSLGYGWLYDQKRGWYLTTEDREGRDASDEGDVSYHPETMNPTPIRAKRIRRAA
ncbi:MAG: hypothetical protein ACYC0C_16935 [Devosia sp.]